MVADQQLQLADGEFAPESWVYVWRRPSGEVLYVGATGLPLAVRTWLHVHEPDPAIGRVAAEVPEALTGEVEVLGFRVPPEVGRQQVRRGVQASVDGAAQPEDVDDEAWAVAERITAELASS